MNNPIQTFPVPAFADALQAYMDAAGITGADLAKRLGRTPAQISQWVNGRKIPNLVTANEIAKALEALIEVRGGEYVIRGKSNC